MEITLLVAGDPAVSQTLVRFRLSSVPGIKIVGMAHSIKTVAALAIILRPDVVLVDEPLMRGGDVETMRRISEGLPGTRILILSERASTNSVWDDPTSQMRYVSQGCTLEGLAEAIHGCNTILHP